MCPALVREAPYSMPVKLVLAAKPVEPSALAAHGWAKIRQIFNIMPKDVATVWSRELLVKLELEQFDLNLREIIWLN